MPLESTTPMRQIGKYEVIHKIADGGMGSVYKARDTESDEIVAVKVLASTARNPTLLQRFEQEFRVAAMLDHPNIVRAIEYCGDAEAPFLVMEYVDGESLGQRIDRGGAIPEDESVRIVSQVCQGLHKAHKFGLIHRDIKPDNILLNSDGQAKVTDMGLVKNLEDELNLTRTGRGLGTPYYMAPEQFRNAKNADVRCDVYSLAATLYAMLTGETPFGKLGPLDCWMKKHHNEFPTPREINPKVSERADWAIRRAMSGDPDQRPANCREFYEDLTGQSTKAPSQPAAQQPQAQDVWYLVYRDETGEQHTVKGSTDAIRKALKEQLLGDAENVRACRSKQGPFMSLRHFPEFRDLLVRPGRSQPQSPPTPTGGSGSRLGRGGSRRSDLPPTRNEEALGHPKPPTPTGGGGSSHRYDQTKAPRPGGGLNRPRGGESSGRLPHMPVPGGNKPGGSPEWLIWVIVLVVAVGSALAGAMLFR